MPIVQFRNKEIDNQRNQSHQKNYRRENQLFLQVD